MSDDRPSGEINTLILARITEVASKVETVATGQADLKTAMLLQFQDGKHRMDGLDMRIVNLEKNGCQRLAQPQQAATAAAATTVQVPQQPKTDEDSDWSKPGKHAPTPHRKREAATEPISKKIDLALWVKLGAVLGAAIAGAYAAIKGTP